MEAIITVGIPCSGKSTYAAQKVAEGWVEVNRDDLRMELFDLDFYNQYRFSKEREEKVTEEERNRMIKAASEGKNLIVSDTNLGKGRVERLQDFLEGLGYEVSVIPFVVDFFDALKRNDKRALEGKYIPRQVMYDMYRRFMDFLEERGEWKRYVPDTNLPAAYIVDIDGTISTNPGRRGFYEWDKVDQDDVVVETVRIVRNLYRLGYKIILLSGRDEICREKTIAWCRMHNIPFDELYMRPHKSMEKDRYVKQNLFWKHVAPRYNVLAVFDDRPQVALLWYDLGVHVFKVGCPVREF